MTESEPRSFLSRIVYLLASVTIFGLILYLPYILSTYKQECTIAIPVSQSGKISYADTYTPEECVELETAATREAQIKGLSGRESMPDNQGLLFVFEKADEKCIWMKDMKFSLDIIWVNENKEIIDIKRGVSPKTYPKNYCAGPTKYVIELNAGVAAKARLGVGQKLNL